MKKKILLAIFALLIFSVLPFEAMAEESAFIKDFTQSYRASNLARLSALVKKYKDAIPEEVESLIKDAAANDKTYFERMDILDVANVLATMHIEWNAGDPNLLKKVEDIQKKEITEEKKRVEEKEKYKREEKVPGNFVLMTHNEEMERQKLAPVLYPHWVHRLFFRCKVCHEGIEKMKRGANDISHKTMAEGKFCGACHNGKLSFPADKDCERCHMAGTDKAKPFRDLTRFTDKDLKEIAARLGSTWEPEKLPGKTYPRDKFGFINWVELDKSGAFKPLDKIDGEEKDEGLRDNLIYFESSIGFMKGVLFSHKIHSTWVKCSLCHEDVFKSELNANKIVMKEVLDGKHCGKCHGRVSFTFSDCMRCHAFDKKSAPSDALIHPAKPKEPKE
ncbi:MAG: c(7)-type cytochrome triheme domain-containing protein [Thermodesulfobacteriota bacterium]